MPITQFNNTEKKSLDSSRFRRLNNPVHAWGDINSFVMSLPGLVGYWPGAIDRGTPLLLDVSGNGLHLTRNGDAVIRDHFDIARSFASFLELDGNGDYFSHADDARLDITGAEAIIDSSAQGLTMMAWVYLEALPAAGLSSYIMAKRAGAGTASYALRVAFDSGLYMELSANGTSISSTGVTYSTLGEWHLVAGVFSNALNTFIPSVNLEAPGGGAFSSTIFAGTAPFTIGADGLGAQAWEGRISRPILCASALPQVVIDTYYQMTAPLFAKQV